MLDHNAKKLRVHASNDPMSEYKLFGYNDIISVSKNEETKDKQM